MFIPGFSEAGVPLKWMPWQWKLKSGTSFTKREAHTQVSHYNHSRVCGDTGVNKPTVLSVP